MYTEKGYQASVKYKAQKIKRVPLDMQITEYEKVKAYAQAQGESVNGFIKQAIRERMERDTQEKSMD